jgi:hypothetical protein
MEAVMITLTLTVTMGGEVTAAGEAAARTAATRTLHQRQTRALVTLDTHRMLALALLLRGLPLRSCPISVREVRSSRKARQAPLAHGSVHRQDERQQHSKLHARAELEVQRGRSRHHLEMQVAGTLRRKWRWRSRKRRGGMRLMLTSPSVHLAPLAATSSHNRRRRPTHRQGSLVTAVAADQASGSRMTMRVLVLMIVVVQAAMGPHHLKVIQVAMTSWMAARRRPRPRVSRQRALLAQAAQRRGKVEHVRLLLSVGVEVGLRPPPALPMPKTAR